MRHNDVNNITLPPATVYVISRMFEMSLIAKKVDYVFKEPFSLHIDVG